jgi:hypothetical protein
MVHSNVLTLGIVQLFFISTSLAADKFETMQINGLTSRKSGCYYEKYCNLMISDLHIANEFKYLGRFGLVNERSSGRSSSRSSSSSSYGRSYRSSSRSGSSSSGSCKGSTTTCVVIPIVCVLGFVILIVLMIGIGI